MLFKFSAPRLPSYPHRRVRLIFINFAKENEEKSDFSFCLFNFQFQIFEFWNFVLVHREGANLMKETHLYIFYRIVLPLVKFLLIVFIPREIFDCRGPEGCFRTADKKWRHTLPTGALSHAAFVLAMNWRSVFVAKVTSYGCCKVMDEFLCLTTCETKLALKWKWNSGGFHMHTVLLAVHPGTSYPCFSVGKTSSQLYMGWWIMR